jgi:hypothetical protein
VVGNSEAMLKVLVNGKTVQVGTGTDLSGTTYQALKETGDETAL